MPTLNRPGCRHPGCNQRQLAGKRFCAAHQREQWKTLDRDRGSAAERGYGADWQRFREWFVARHPLCEDCLDMERVTATEEVHHLRKVKDAPELRLVEANCRGLCVTCHAARTRRGE